MLDILVILFLIVIFNIISSYSQAGSYTLMSVILFEYYGIMDIINPLTYIGVVSGFCFVGIVLDNIKHRKEIEKNVKHARDTAVRTMFGDSQEGS